MKSNLFQLGWGLGKDFVSLFFPNYCFGCRNSLVKGEDLLCTACLLDLPKTNYHLENNNPVAARMEGRLPLRFATSFLHFRKKGITQRLLHQLKYNHQPQLGIRLGKIFGNDLFPIVHNHLDLIIPVPLHESRLRHRGYNQSAQLAKGISEALQIPYSDKYVIRIKSTTTQTRKNKVERWNNVKDVFQVIEEKAIKNKRVLLVDDVFTTGATLEACGQKIMQAGCSELSIACLAEA